MGVKNISGRLNIATFHPLQVNLLRFVQSKVLMEDIKKKMLEQTDLYLKVCNNILGDTANIEEIYSSAQKISELKTKLQKKMDIASTELPEHFISPLLCFAKYSLVANHLPRDFDRYCQSYNQSYFNPLRTEYPQNFNFWA